MTTIPHDEINDLTLKEAVDSHAQRSGTVTGHVNAVIKQPYAALAPRIVPRLPHLLQYISMIQLVRVA
ncbi:hypothetical protein ACKLNR_008686 [Fusarium oxysporum f. sp. zingiberi]